MTRWVVAVLVVSALVLGAWLWRSTSSARTSPSAHGHEESPRASERDVDVVVVDICAHPLVPIRVGSSSKYAIVLDGGRGELSYELSGREIVGESQTNRWRSRLDLNVEGAAVPPLEQEVVTECDRNSAEVPWSFVAVPGLAEVDVDWRWPKELRVGTRFEGDVILNLLGVRHVTRRRHEVSRRESIEVSAGRFDTWRVDFVDTTPSGEALPGTAWVDDHGLVRLDRQTSSTASSTIELLERSVD